MDSKAVIPFQTPSNVLIAARTLGGKTHLVYQILKNSSSMFEIVPQAIIYC